MIKHCPQCNAKARRTTGMPPLAYCPQCGWQQRAHGQAAGESRAPVDVTGGLLVKLALAWLFGIALVFGPYIAILIYFPAPEAWVHIVYWLVMFIYLAAAATSMPRVDMNNLGMAGGLIDNPFTWEDDINRAGLFFTIILIPGKIATWAITTTWRIVRG